MTHIRNQHESYDIVIDDYVALGKRRVISSFWTKTDLKREIVTTLIVFLLFATVSLVMVWEMTYASYYSPTDSILKDALYDIIPQLKYYYLPDIPLLTSFGVVLVWLISTRPNLMIYTIRNILLFCVPMFVLRGLFLFVTVLPDPNGLCFAANPQLVAFKQLPFKIAYPEIMKHYLRMEYSMCADLIFSGHTLFSLYMTVLVYHLKTTETNPKIPKWVDTTVLSLTYVLWALTIVFIIATRFHYTIDVLIAIVMVFYNSIAMQSFIKWCVRTRKFPTFVKLYYGAFEPHLDESTFLLPAPRFYRSQQK